MIVPVLSPTLKKTHLSVSRECVSQIGSARRERKWLRLCRGRPAHSDLAWPNYRRPGQQMLALHRGSEEARWGPPRHDPQRECGLKAGAKAGELRLHQPPALPSSGVNLRSIRTQVMLREVKIGYTFSSSSAGFLFYPPPLWFSLCVEKLRWNQHNIAHSPSPRPQSTATAVEITELPSIGEKMHDAKHGCANAIPHPFVGVRLCDGRKLKNMASDTTNAKDFKHSVLDTVQGTSIEHEVSPVHQDPKGFSLKTSLKSFGTNVGIRIMTCAMKRWKDVATNIHERTHLGLALSVSVVS